MNDLSFAQADRIQQTAKKIIEFKGLPTGWHFGKGVPPSESTVEKAFALNQEAAKAGFTRTNAFPGIEGEIQVTIYLQSAYFEFTIEPNGTVTFVYERDNHEIEYTEALSMDEALKKIQSLGGPVWASSGLFIKSTTTQIQEVSKALHLNLPVMAVESPSLKRTVSEKVAQASVNILSDFTKVYQVSRLSSGGSPSIPFLMIAGSSKKPATQEMIATATS